MSLRPLFDNVWGVPLYNLDDQWSSNLTRPVMSRKEKVLHVIKVCEVGKDCKEIQPGSVVIIPEDNGGVVVEILLADGTVQRRYSFSEKVAMLEYTGDVDTVISNRLAKPQSF